MRVDLFDFDLPPERIALRPARPRDRARMLVVEGGQIRDRSVLDLPGCCGRATCWCSTTRKVIPAQLEGRRGDARIGATLHKREGPRALAGVRPQRQAPARGDTIEFGERRDCIGGRARRRRRGRCFTSTATSRSKLLLERAGRMPLPPYIAWQARRPTRPTAPTTRRCSRARKARSPRRPPRCTSRPADRGARRSAASAARR